MNVSYTPGSDSKFDIFLTSDQRNQSLKIINALKKIFVLIVFEQMKNALKSICLLKTRNNVISSLRKSIISTRTVRKSRFSEKDSDSLWP